MKKSCGGIELVEGPSLQHCAGNNRTCGVHSGNSSEGFVVVDALPLPIPFDDQTRLPHVVSLDLEHPFASDHLMSRRNVRSTDLYPGSILNERVVLFLNGCPPLG